MKLASSWPPASKAYSIGIQVAPRSVTGRIVRAIERQPTPPTTPV
ncbi:hypothetical protein [Parapedobacter sp. DT-150]